MTNSPDPFEMKVMKLALRGDAEWINGMKNQLDYLRVANRKAVGGGFVTNFNRSEEAEPVVIPRREDGLPIEGYPPTVNAKRNLPTEGLASFIVWLGQDGTIRQLEAMASEYFSGIRIFSGRRWE